jgi:hypothetical protein
MLDDQKTFARTFAKCSRLLTNTGGQTSRSGTRLISLALTRIRGSTAGVCLRLAGQLSSDPGRAFAAEVVEGLGHPSDLALFFREEWLPARRDRELEDGDERGWREIDRG